MSDKISFYEQKILNGNINLLNVNNDMKFKWSQNIADRYFTYSMEKLKLIPIEFCIQEMVDKYIECNINSFFENFAKNEKFQKFFTLEIVEKYWNMNGCVMKFRNIPTEFLTQKICDDTVNFDIEKFRFVPEKFQTQEMANKFFEFDMKNFTIIPAKFQTQEMANTLFNFDNFSFLHINNCYQTQKMANIFYNNNNSFFDRIPKKFITYNIAFDANKHHFNSIDYIPEKFKIYEFIKSKSTRHNCYRISTKRDVYGIFNVMFPEYLKYSKFVTKIIAYELYTRNTIYVNFEFDYFRSLYLATIWKIKQKIRKNNSLEPSLIYETCLNIILRWFPNKFVKNELGEKTIDKVLEKLNDKYKMIFK